MLIASDLKANMVLRHQGQLYQVLAAEFHKGGGKMGGIETTKLRSLTTGTLAERRFRPDEKLEVVEVEKQNLEYLYQDGDLYVFMNPENYEQVGIDAARLGNRVRFLKENMVVVGLFFDQQLLNLQFPEYVDLRVTTAPPPRHEQETSTYKTIRLENGMEILAPQFIKEGDSVRVHVETGKYMQRV